MTFLTSNEDILLAVKPGGDGDATETHVAWKQRRAIPEIPSPLFYDGRLYLVKNGGIVTCLDPQTGKTIYRERLGSGGQYAASPVAADGRIYVTSEAGVVSVLKAGDTFEVMSENDLAERIMATPAIVGDTLYVRTDQHLFAFRNNGK
jgi:outer membrane protein assembly factor BamB